MIRFKDVTLSDKAIIQRFTMFGERQNCDLSFANIICWQFLYNTQYAIVDDYLVFRFFTGHHLAYMMPLAEPRDHGDGILKVLPEEECNDNVLKAIRDDSVAMGHPFLMLGVCNYMLDIIESKFPGFFISESFRERADYIYTREKLIHLTGKKLQGKRNHINKFKTLYPKYEYKSLTLDLIPACIELESRWKQKAKDGRYGRGINEEYRSIIRAFNYWEKLELVGGTIWVHDKLIAFTYGCPINNSTFDVCVEKADTDYEGAYAMINHEFISHLPENYYYINREEDLGDEGLRRAKLSYKPDILLEKNSVREKLPLRVFKDQLRIKEETKVLWRRTFPADSETFIDLYFSRVYRGEDNVVSQIDNHVVAALQAIPYSMQYDGRKIKTAYISGVAVSNEYRQENIGNSLMLQAHHKLYYKKVVATTLIPAEEWVADWYGRLGYAKVITCTPPPTNLDKLSYEDFITRQISKRCVILHSKENYDVVQEDYRQIPDYYISQRKPVVAMLRIIDAHAVLQLYAECNPEVELSIRVSGDSHIPLNNSYYSMKRGVCIRCDEPLTNAENISIQGLARLVFGSMGAEMCLMLN